MARRILLVEDEPDLSPLLVRELARHGYAVSTAPDAPSALARFRQQPPDLVILDWMLPRGDGLDVLREIRRTSTVPVLMLTARGDEIDRVLGLELGADDYLTKPFSLRELVARIRALLRHADLVRSPLATERPDESTPLVYGPLRLDPSSYVVLLHDQPLDLSPIEFRLLELLLRHPGRAFSRSYLLETLWPEPSVSDRAVDNAVYRLRQKLGSLGEAIETVWGIGYRLRPPGKDR